MKKNTLIFLIILCASSLFSDSFREAIQDLAVQIACTGKYSATMAGGTWRDDPIDYYTPTIMAPRFSDLSGDTTEYQTFYGVCYNYAKYAYNDIRNCKNWYEKQGLKHDQFFIVGVDNDTNDITLVDLANSSNYTLIRNGEYLRLNRHERIKTHKDAIGDRAKNHAWLWMQCKDGTWYWVDPTWTDNLGYVVYGYVDKNTGEEVQLKPDKGFCIIYPDYLNDLPSYPYEAVTKTENENVIVPNSYPVKNSSSSSIDLNPDDITLAFGLIFPFDSNKNYTKRNGQHDGYQIALEVSADETTDNIYSIFFFDYLETQIDWKDTSAWLLGLDIGYSIFGFIEPYVGIGLGQKKQDTKKEFEYILNAGCRINLKYLTLRAEVSDCSYLGKTFTISVGTSVFSQFLCDM